MWTLTFAASSLLALTLGLPLRYDQRQEGDLNIHAHLENFVIVLIPQSTGISLYDFITLKKNADTKPSTADGKYTPPSTGIKSSSPNFPASNSPYKVDIGKKSGSEETEEGHDKPSIVIADEVVIAQSLPKIPETAPETTSTTTTTEAIATTITSVSDEPIKESEQKVNKEVANDSLDKDAETPVKNEEIPAIPEKNTEKEADKKEDVVVPVTDSAPEKPPKAPKSIDFAVEDSVSGKKKPIEDDIPVIDFVPPVKTVKSSKLPSFRSDSSVDTDEAAQKLKLLRTGLEECGPGQRRDRHGNCQYKSRSGQFFSPETRLPALQFGLSPAVD